jgi:hypothetical protein
MDFKTSGLNQINSLVSHNQEGVCFVRCRSDSVYALYLIRSISNVKHAILCLFYARILMVRTSSPGQSAL